MRLPIPLTKLECVLWLGVGLVWAGPGSLSAARNAGAAQISDGRICHANGQNVDESDKQLVVQWTKLPTVTQRKIAMSTKSINSIMSILVLCLAVSACTGLPTTARVAADQGSDLQQTSRDQAKWDAGIDSAQD